MKQITIPTYANPFYVIINGVEFAFTAGETISVTDSVAEAIENALALLPKTDPNAGKSTSLKEANDYTDAKIAVILNGADMDFDTLGELQRHIVNLNTTTSGHTTSISKNAANISDLKARVNTLEQAGSTPDIKGGDYIDIINYEGTIYISYNPNKVNVPVGLPEGAKLVDYGVNSYHLKNGKLYIDVTKIPTDDTIGYLFINGSDYDSDGHEEESASIVISAGYTGYFGSLYVFDSNSMTGVPIDTSKSVMEIDASALGWTSSDIVTSARNNDAIYYVPNE